MVISVPVTTMGSKSLSEVLPKVYSALDQDSGEGYDLRTVVPANVTVVPCLSLVKRMVELAGAEMFSRTMFVQDATTEVI